ncbi:MAG: hypothetical protein AAF282_04100 [Cyanobacteria bacterium P01_A01_bin.15]
MGSDVLILTIYFLVVIYVLYQMALSVEKNLEDRLLIKLDTDTLLGQVSSQLQQQPYTERITAAIDRPKYGRKKLPPQLALRVQSQQSPKKRQPIMVEVGPTGTMPMGRALSSLKLTIRNNTQDAQVYVDWDRSSLTTDPARQAQRVVRTGVLMDSSLSRPQVLGVINPGESISTQVTGETCLGVEPKTQTLVPTRPLVNMTTVAMTALPDDMVDDEMPAITAYGLRLMVGVRRVTEQESYTTYLLLPFGFQAFLLKDEIAFPPLRWLLNRPRPVAARDALSTLLLGRSSRR